MGQPGAEMTVPVGEIDGRSTDRIWTVATALGRMPGFKVEVRCDMDAWLKYHVALLMPSLAPAFYTCDMDRMRMVGTRDALVLAVRASRIVYQRTEAAADHFHGLSAQLRALLEPDARPEMVRRTLEIFQGAGYDFYLLRQQAARGHQSGCLQQAHAILRTMLNCLAVCNQQCSDTRKLAQSWRCRSCRWTLPPRLSASSPQ